MNILFVAMGYPSKVDSHSIVFLKRIVDELCDQGHICTVIVPVKRNSSDKKPEYHERQITKQGKEVNVYFPRYTCGWLTSRGKKDFIRDFSVNSYCKAIERVVQQENIQFDCVYSHFLGVSAEGAVRVAKKYNRPVFAAAGESKFSYLENFDRESTLKHCSKLNGVVSVSTENKEYLLHTGVFKDEDIIVLPNGIDGGHFYPRDKKEARKKFGFLDDDFIVAFVGSFIERKGALRLAAAVDGLDVKVAYAGSGAEKPPKKHTIFCDTVSPDDMPWFLSAADVFCLPTLSEGCCNAIIEAMACGLPIISSNGAFNDDILEETYSIRVDPMNIDDIKDAIFKLKNDVELRLSMAECAAKKGANLSVSERAAKIATFIKNKSGGT